VSAAARRVSGRRGAARAARAAWLAGGSLALAALAALVAWRAGDGAGPEPAAATPRGEAAPGEAAPGGSARGDAVPAAAATGVTATRRAGGAARPPPLETTRDPGQVDAPEPGLLRWALTFPSGVWTLRFRAGGPATLAFEDLSGTVSRDCAELVAVTPRGPAPLPTGRFADAPRGVTLDDVPLEVVQALATAPELALVACERHFVLEAPQRASLRAFYLQAAGLVLDALGGAAAAAPGEPR
jgi:hypothetical protein